MEVFLFMYHANVLSVIYLGHNYLFQFTLKWVYFSVSVIRTSLMLLKVRLMLSAPVVAVEYLEKCELRKFM